MTTPWACSRCNLVRSRRFFADLVVMSDALRPAIHLHRKVRHPLFMKVGARRKLVTHVAKIRSTEEVASHARTR